MHWHFSLGAILLLFVACNPLKRAHALGDILEPSSHVADTHRVGSYSAGAVSPIEEPILELIKKLASEDPSKKHVKMLLAEQESYDFNPKLSSVDILFRSGFRYEIHNFTSTDGYQTKLVRIINPFAHQEHIKRPPVVMYAGQGASTGVFLMTAIGKIRPLAWPRAANWPAQARESNRSLAITLSNNGYDVWLVPARGVDQWNRGRNDDTQAGGDAHIDFFNLPFLDPERKNKREKGSIDLLAIPEKIKHFFNTLFDKSYWSFSSDEIIRYEFKLQLELIRSITQTEKVSLITYSNGAFVAFGFMAREHEYARKHIDSIISIAPAVYINKLNLIIGLTGLLSNLNPPNWPIPESHLDALARQGAASLCRSKTIRYTLCKTLLNDLYGYSDLFNTHLELSMIDYVGRPQSANALRQMLQASYLGQMREYDHGVFGNLITYGTLAPPEYDLSLIKHPHLYIVSGGKDAIVNDNSIAQLVSSLGQQPERWINVPEYNHLDLLAGHDNAERVNLPILELLDDRNLEVDYYRESSDETNDNTEDEMISSVSQQDNNDARRVANNNRKQQLRRKQFAGSQARAMNLPQTIASANLEKQPQATQKQLTQVSETTNQTRLAARAMKSPVAASVTVQN